MAFHQSKYILVDNSDDGFSLLNTDTGKILRKFTFEDSYQTMLKRVAKQAAFTTNAKLIVGGSNNGFVYIWDRRTGSVVEKLRHSGGGMVQTVSVSNCILLSLYAINPTGIQ